MGFFKTFLAILVLTFACTAHAAAKSSGSSSSSSSSSSSKDQNILFQVSGGTSTLDQYMANEHVEHPFAGMVAGRFHKYGLQAGVCYLTMYHHDATGANPPGQFPNVNEVDATETFALTSVCGGFLINDFIMLDVGYGIANFSRKESQPNALSAQSSSYTATGSGVMAGGSLIPIRMGPFGIGATYYYFDATATDYSSDVVNGTTETIKSSGNGRVHTFGTYAGVSLFFNL